MRPVNRPFHSESELQDLVLEVVQWLAEGACVGIPTAHGYVGLLKGIWSAAALPAALSGLNSSQDAATSATTGLQAGLGLQHACELHDYFRPVSPAAERLLERHPAGAVTLLLPAAACRFASILDETASSLRTGAGSQTAAFLSERPFVGDGKTAVACQLLSGKIGPLVQALCPWPVLILSATTGTGQLSGEPVRTLSQLEQLIPGGLNYTIDAGELDQAQSRAIVEVRERGVKVIEAGQLSDAVIMERSGPSLLFVCTGNTCRSPMAEAICRKLLADRLGCAPDELTRHGIEIASAGIAADYGYPASPEAVELLSQDGIVLTEHQSQPLSAAQLDRADLVLTMTAHHRQVILTHRPDLGERVQVLGIGARDIPDPIGCSLEVYRQCRQAIEAGLQPIIDQLIRELESNG